MTKLMFCDKCGRAEYSGTCRPGQKCIWCKKGHYIDTGLDYHEACSIIQKENHISLGNYSVSESEEILRKKFFYDSSYNNLDSKMVDRREIGEATCNQILHDSNIPKCPVCGSTYLRKVTATRKILKVGLFGRLGTGDLGKTYQCCKCGAKF